MGKEGFKNSILCFQLEKNFISTGKIKNSSWIVFLCQLVKMGFNTYCPILQ